MKEVGRGGEKGERREGKIQIWIVSKEDKSWKYLGLRVYITTVAGFLVISSPQYLRIHRIFMILNAIHYRKNYFVLNFL